MTVSRDRNVVENAGDGPTGPVTFAIVIATYNRAGLMRQAIASALGQDRAADEVWVVDDGSSDGTAEALAVFEGAIRVIHTDHGGLGAARNRAVERSKAEYVVFLDDDDRLLPWALATYEGAIGAFDRPTIVMSAPFHFTHDEDVRELVRDSPRWTYWPDFFAAASARKSMTICTAIRRRALTRAGGFAEHVVGSEDIDMFLRLGAEPGYVYVDAPSVYAYRQMSGSMSRNALKVHGGVRRLLASDRRGVYGQGRRMERSLVLARNVRFAMRRLLDVGAWVLALDLLLRGSSHLLRAGQLGEAAGLVDRAARRGLRSVWVRRGRSI